MVCFVLVYGCYFIGLCPVCFLPCLIVAFDLQYNELKINNLIGGIMFENLCDNCSSRGYMGDEDILCDVCNGEGVIGQQDDG
jgi:hypothetical protein